MPEPAHPNPLLESFAGHIHPELCYLVTVAVGFRAGVYWLRTITPDDARFGTPSEPFEYQVMRENTSAGGSEFWSWHLANMPQWFETPEAACAAFVHSWDVWCSQGKPRA